MSRVADFPVLLGRQALVTAAASTAAAAQSTAAGCDTGNEYDGRIGVRISAIFVILIGSTLGQLPPMYNDDHAADGIIIGAAFPVYAARHRGVGVPDWAFFVAKYFGSGVIIATAFIHVSSTLCSSIA